MTPRRLILATVVLGLMGSTGAAFASPGTEPMNKRVCVMGTDDPATHSWDGVCVSIPVH